MRSFFSYIVKNQRHVVPDFDPGHERVDQPRPEVVIGDVTIPERAQPGLDHFTSESGPFYFCPLDLDHESLLLVLQGAQTRDQAPGPAFLDGVQQVPLALPDGVQTAAESSDRVVGQLLLLDLQDADGQLVDHVIGQHIVDRGQDHSVLQTVLGDRLHLALLPALLVSALVIVVHLPSFTGASLCVKHGATVPAEAFTAQQIVHLRPPCCIVAARFEVLRGLLEGGLVNNRFHRQPDTLDLKLAQILPVSQHPVYDIMRDRPATLANDPMAPEMLHQILHRGACNVHLERLADQGGPFFVDDYMTVGVYFVAYGERLAAILPLLRCLLHASDDLLPEISGVILGQTLQHALQNDPLRALRDAFLRIHQLDAGTLQGQFTQGDVLAIPAEAVDLPHQDAVKQTALRVPQHPLELVTADDTLAGDLPVGIHLDDVDPVLLCIIFTISHLALDGLLRLAWAG